jgi:hypothetical protein
LKPIVFNLLKQSSSAHEASKHVHQMPCLSVLLLFSCFSFTRRIGWCGEFCLFRLFPCVFPLLIIACTCHLLRESMQIQHGSSLLLKVLTSMGVWDYHLNHCSNTTLLKGIVMWTSSSTIINYQLSSRTTRPPLYLYSTRWVLTMHPVGIHCTTAGLGRGRDLNHRQGVNRADSPPSSGINAALSTQDHTPQPQTQHQHPTNSSYSS